MDSENQKVKIYRNTFISIISILTIFRLIYARLLPISADEAYFWQWSRHLDLCYYEQPPMTGIIVALFTLFKSTPLTVRLAPIVLLLGTTILVYLLAKEMFQDERVAFWAGLLMNIAPIFAVGGIIITTDAPLGFFWMLTLYSVYKATNSKKRYWWWLSGLALGFAFLTKFISIFILLSVSFFLLFCKEKRKWLSRKEPYLAFILALIVFSPVIIWNASRDWATFKYNLGMRYVSSDASLKFKYFLEYIGGQAFILSPFLFLGSLAGISHCGYRGIRSDDRYLFLFFPSVLILFMFGIYSWFDRVAPHWVACGYLTSFIALPGLFLGEERKNIYRNFWIAIVSLAIFMTFLIHIIPLYPKIFTSLTRSKKGSVNEINIFLSGWMEDLGKKISLIKKEMAEDTFILCRGFALASYVAFYTDGQYETYSIGQTTPHGHAYEYWSDFNSLLGKDAIFVKEGEKEGSYVEKLKVAFGEIKKEPVLEIRRNGQVIKRFSIWRCYNFKGFEQKTGSIN
jgi:4-amino-4-deoxy-L-arabinose transferase-like glycosyltransferase